MSLRNVKEKQFGLRRLVLLVALSSLAVLVSLIVTSCQRTISDPITYWCRLIGDANQIKGVAITIFDGRSLMDVKVKENGLFDLASVGDYVGAPRTVFVTKEGYLPYVKNVTANRDFGPIMPLINRKVGVLTGVCYLATADKKSKLFGRIGDYKSNVKITARNREKEYEFLSNSDGIFVQQLPEGEYTLEGENIRPRTEVKILNGKTTIFNINSGEYEKKKRMKS